MNRVVSFFIAAVMCALPGTVFAAEYDIKDNYVDNIEEGKYRTIVVVKGNDINNIEDAYINYNDIVGIAQTADDQMITAAMKFYLKNQPEDGEYTVLLGGRTDSTTSDKLEFFIGSPLEFGEVHQARKWVEGDDIAFGWENIETISNYKSILIQIGEKVFGLSLSDMENFSGSISLGLKITDVPEIPDGMNAYLSANSIEDERLDLK